MCVKGEAWVKAAAVGLRSDSAVLHVVASGQQLHNQLIADNAMAIPQRMPAISETMEVKGVLGGAAVP